jgi:hypothetical protein
MWYVPLKERQNTKTSDRKAYIRAEFQTEELKNKTNVTSK